MLFRQIHFIKIARPPMVLLKRAQLWQRNSRSYASHNRDNNTL